MAAYSGMIKKRLRQAQELEQAKFRKAKTQTFYTKDDYKRFGDESEKRFLRIFEEARYWYRLPLWLKRIERATKEEDQKGVDFHAITAEGLRVPIDVKSSVRALQKTLESLKKKGEDRSHIVFIVMYESDKVVFEIALKKLLARRNNLLKNTPWDMETPI